MSSKHACGHLVGSTDEHVSNFADGHSNAAAVALGVVVCATVTVAFIGDGVVFSFSVFVVCVVGVLLVVGVIVLAVVGAAAFVGCVLVVVVFLIVAVVCVGGGDGVVAAAAVVVVGFATQSATRPWVREPNHAHDLVATTNHALFVLSITGGSMLAVTITALLSVKKE